MKKIITLLFVITVVFSFGYAAEGGTLTPNPNPIIPNQSVLISYDGTGTNFASWTPRCFIHVWLVPKTGQTFTGNYAPAWATCNSEGDYDAIDAKYKMTHDGVTNSGKYSITISNLYTFMGVLNEDKTKIDKFGVIVRAQYSGDNNQTQDFLLNVGDATTSLSSSNFNPSFNLSSQTGTIKVRFNGNAQVDLFSLTGQLIHSESAVNQFTQAVENGVYLLRINGQTHKVLVR